MNADVAPAAKPTCPACCSDTGSIFEEGCSLQNSMAHQDVDAWLPQYFASLVQDAREDWIALGETAVADVEFHVRCAPAAALTPWQVMALISCAMARDERWISFMKLLDRWGRR